MPKFKTIHICLPVIFLLLTALLLLNSCAWMVVAQVREGDMTGVERHLGRGTDVNAKDLGGHTALGTAAREGRLDIAMLLIDYGALVDARGAMGSTPLMLASAEGHEDMVRFLIASGADVNARRPVFYCTESVSLLGEPVHRTYINPSTPLMAASAQGHSDIVLLLLDFGADVNFFDEEGYTALRWASQQEHEMTGTVFQTVNVLVEAGAMDPSVSVTRNESGEIIGFELR